MNTCWFGLCGRSFIFSSFLIKVPREQMELLKFWCRVLLQGCPLSEDLVQLDVLVLTGLNDEDDVALPASKQEPVLVRLSSNTHRANIRKRNLLRTSARYTKRLPRHPTLQLQPILDRRGVSQVKEPPLVLSKKKKKLTWLSGRRQTTTKSRPAPSCRRRASVVSHLLQSSCWTSSPRSIFVA